jgi:hypothetical protein
LKSSPEEVLSYAGIRLRFIWSLDFLSNAAVRTQIEKSTESVSLLKRALGAVSAIRVMDERIAFWLEDVVGVAVCCGRSWESLVASVRTRCLIGVGAGIGNILQTTPLIRSVAEHIGSPVDIYIESPVPGVSALFGNSPWINMVFENKADIAAKPYERAFVTGSAGQIIPPINCDDVVVQRRKYRMHVECRKMHETRFNYLGIEEVFPDLQFSIADTRRYFLRDLRYSSVGKKVIGLCDGKKEGIWQRREWGRYVELVPLLKNAGHIVRSFGVAGQYVEGTEDYTGTSLRKTFQNLLECDCVVASDGGLFHIAEALGVPTVVMFGPTGIVKNGPVSDNVRLIHKRLPCSPCQFKVDFHRCDDNRCMSEISPEEVASIVSELTSGEPKNCKKVNLRVLDETLEHEREGGTEFCRSESEQDFFSESFSIYPDNIDFFVRAVRGNIRFRRIDRASRILLEAGSRYENSSVLDVLRAEILFARKEFEGVCRVCREILAEDRATPRDILLYMRALSKLEHWEKVVELGFDGNAENPIEAERAWLVGNAQRFLRRFSAAQESMEWSLRVRPNSPWVREAIETLRDDVYRRVDSRKSIDREGVCRVAALTLRREPFPELFCDYRDQVSIYRMYFDELEALEDSLDRFDLVCITAKDDAAIEEVARQLSFSAKRKALLCFQGSELKRKKPLFVKGILSGVPLNSSSRDSLAQLISKISVAERSHKSLGKFAGKRFILCAHHHMHRWNPHGGEYSMRAIVERVQELGGEVLVVVANMKNNQVFCEDFDEIRYVVSHTTRFEDTLRHALESYMPDCVLSWGPQSMVSAPICKEYGLPYIMFVRYWKVFCDPPYSDERMLVEPSEHERSWYGKLYKCATKVITNGQYVSDVIMKKYGAASEVAYVPVYPPDEGYAPPPIAKRPYVTLVNPRKAGGEYIIRELARRLPEIPFQVIGEPSIHLPDNVELHPYFKGHYTEMLANTRVLLFPWAEVPCGTGRVVFEAFYAGVPVVSVNTGGMKEVIPPEWLVSENEAYAEWEAAVASLYYEQPDGLVESLSQRMASFPPEAGMDLVVDTLDRTLSKQQ